MPCSHATDAAQDTIPSHKACALLLACTMLREAAFLLAKPAPCCLPACCSCGLLRFQQHVEEVRVARPQLLGVVPQPDAVRVLAILCADPVTYRQRLRSIDALSAWRRFHLMYFMSGLCIVPKVSMGPSGSDAATAAAAAVSNVWPVAGQSPRAPSAIWLPFVSSALLCGCRASILPAALSCKSIKTERLQHISPKQRKGPSAFKS